MRIEHFRYEFKRMGGFYILPETILFCKPLELWNERTGKSVVFKTFDEMFAYEINGRSIKDIILGLNKLVIPSLTGGRGSPSGQSKSFKFGHAGGSGSGTGSDLLPAKANVRIKSKTLEGAMQEFRKSHVDSDHEWAYEIDPEGYVHQYKEGGSTSVAIGGSIKDGIILHNHPVHGEPAFSDSDLISAALGREKGIVASSRNWDYIFQKNGGHFKASEFVKAVKSATIVGKDYNDAVDKWLKANAKKYGYTYKRKYHPAPKKTKP